MKFSKKLYYKANPKYRDHYIAYKELKKAIKLITGKDTSTYTIKEVTSNFGNIQALSGAEFLSTESRFQELLNFELDKINNFTINIIKDWYKKADFCYLQLKENKFSDLKSVKNKLSWLGDTLIFLENYKNINFIGFRKITKKFDKHNDKNVSSSFFISVVIKSFFMNFDINVLVCMLSICYKYYRNFDEKKKKRLSDSHKKEGSKHEITENIENNFRKNQIVNRNENDIEININGTVNETYLEEKNELNEILNEQNKNISKLVEKISDSSNGYDLNNKKYIVKLKDLTTIKVEIARYFVLKYSNIEEYEYFKNVKNLFELINKTKKQNYLITIYFDDANLSIYNQFVNKNVSNENKCIRLRSYNYMEGKKHQIKTYLQHFNIYEPSNDMNEQYTSFKDLPPGEIKINCVNDLYSIKDNILKNGDNQNMQNQYEPFEMNNEKIKEFNSIQNKGILHVNKNIEEKKTKSIDISETYKYEKEEFSIENKNQFLSLIDEMEQNNLKSCIKSKYTRIYFYDEDIICGYIDENISYWTHNDKKNIYKHKIEDHEDIYMFEDEYNHDENNYENQNLNKYKKPSRNKSYAYFDYAIIDIIANEKKNKNIFFKLNNSINIKKLYDYSPFLQGISLLYPNSISIFPHWRIFTCTEFMKVELSDYSNEDINENEYNEKKNFEYDKYKLNDFIHKKNSNDLNNIIKKYNTTKDDFRKSIAYTGTSARIKHEHEIMFRDQIEKNKSVDFNFKNYNKNKMSNKLKLIQMRKNSFNVKNNSLYEPLIEEKELYALKQRDKSSRSSKLLNFFKKFFIKKTPIDTKIPKNSIVRVEPKTFFANERTLLQWLNTSVLLSTISITLLNFSNYYGFISGLIMAPVAIFFIIYSFYIYTKRTKALMNKEPINYTDKFGPTLLVVTLILSLTAVVSLNIYSRLKNKNI